MTKIYSIIRPLLGMLMKSHVVPYWRRGAWIEETYMADLLSKLEVDCVIDVGANVGQFGTLLRVIGYTGKIISFEPNPVAFFDLEKLSAIDQNWYAINLALGAEDAILPFHVMASSDFSSFLFPTKERETSFFDQNTIQKTIDIQVKRSKTVFDDLRLEHRYARPFLKMDTQGFDLEVIKGAGPTISEFVGLSTEIAMRRIYDGSPSMSESIKFVNDAGFDFVNFLPVHPTRTLNPVEFNSFAVRRELVT